MYHIKAYATTVAFSLYYKDKINRSRYYHYHASLPVLQLERDIKERNGLL